MSIDGRRKDLDDDRLKTGIAFGFNASQEDTAEFAGKSLSTVKRWKTDPEIIRVSEAVAAYKSIDASKRVKNAVTEAVGNAEDRIRRIFDRATRLTERAVERVEALGDNATIEELMEMHKQITVWASKYAASEAPKRISVEGTMEHTFKAAISLADAENLLIARKQLHNIGPKLIAGESDVIDLIPDA